MSLFSKGASLKGKNSLLEGANPFLKRSPLLWLVKPLVSILGDFTIITHTPMSTDVALSSTVGIESTRLILFFIISTYMSIYVNIYLAEFQTWIYRQTRYTSKIPTSDGGDKMRFYCTSIVSLFSKGASLKGKNLFIEGANSLMERAKPFL